MEGEVVSKFTVVSVSVKLQESPLVKDVVTTPVILRQEYVSGQFVLSLDENTLSTELSIEYVYPSKYQGTIVYEGVVDVTSSPHLERFLCYHLVRTHCTVLKLFISLL